MKKYNSKGELFKLEKGTIQEIKDYQGRTQIYLTQDEDSKKWRMTFAEGFIEYDGRQTWNVRIPYWLKPSKAAIADFLDYVYDEGDDIDALNKELEADCYEFIKELEDKQAE